ncbi:MAG: ABC transporter permease [Ilumatobacteraceae bacterium]
MNTPVSASAEGMAGIFSRIGRPRSGQSVLVTLASSAAAVVLAMLIGGLVLLVTGKDPVEAFSKMVSSGTQPYKLAEAVQRATPLIIAAVAVAIGFKMNLFNIGVEGQFLMGMFWAGVAGAYVELPPVLHVTFCLLIGIIAGAIWAGIAGLLRVKRGVNEVIATIMLNSIALALIDWLFNDFFRYENPGNLDVRTKPLPTSAWMPTLFTVTSKTDGGGSVSTDVTSFVLIALLVVVAFWLLIYKSQFGFRLRASGGNAVAARTAGISSNRMILTAMLLSGGVAGLAGLPALLGTTHSYGPTRPDGYGFNGIAVALLGRNHPAGIIISALLWGFLDATAGPLQIAKIPQSIILVIKAIILITVVIVNEVVNRKMAKRTADRTAAQLAAPVAVTA